MKKPSEFARRRLSPRAGKVIAFLIFLPWALVVMAGRRVPFMETETAFETRTAGLFVLLFSLFIWVGFIFRRQETGMTGYETMMQRLPSRKERIRATLALVAGLILIPLGVAWMSVDVCAFAASLSAAAPFAETYRITDAKPRNRGYLLEMYRLRDRVPVSLYLETTTLMRRDTDWKAGDIVCGKGRSSRVGDVIDSLHRSSIEACGNASSKADRT